jgi:hypothetical protein
LATSSRRDLFSAFIEQLNSAAVEYCVLSGYHDVGSHDSDVDFMVHPRDWTRLPLLASLAAERAGAQLVQAIQHETTACYFVLAKPAGHRLGYLDPDCCTDYRYRGQLWLPADKVLARRRRHRHFYVPSIADEFTYYLIKKTLKQSLAEGQLLHLRHLYQRDPAGCISSILELWPMATIRAAEKAIVQGDLPWFKAHLPTLLAELQACAPAEPLLRRMQQQIRELRRRAGRLMDPTGLLISISGGKDLARTDFAQQLLRFLAPAFRWTAEADLRIPRDKRGRSSRFNPAIRQFIERCRAAVHIRILRRRSTLVAAIFSPSNSGLSQDVHSILGLKRLLPRPDLSFVIDAETTACASSRRPHFSADNPQAFHLPAADGAQSRIQQASHAILQHLAARLQARLAPRIAGLEKTEAHLKENLELLPFSSKAAD